MCWLGVNIWIIWYESNIVVIFDIDCGIWHGYVIGTIDMWMVLGLSLDGIRISWIIELKRICDNLALDLKSHWTYWDLRVNHNGTYGSNHIGTFGSIILGPSGQITMGPTGQSYWHSGNPEQIPDLICHRIINCS